MIYLHYTVQKKIKLDRNKKFRKKIDLILIIQFELII